MKPCIVVKATIHYDNAVEPEWTITNRIYVKDDETYEQAAERAVHEACRQLTREKSVSYRIA
jgi:hypothetical protein